MPGQFWKQKEEQLNLYLSLRVNWDVYCAEMEQNLICTTFLGPAPPNDKTTDHTDETARRTDAAVWLVAVYTEATVF